jgi:L-amino acid N-acyltransferase YncA
MQLVNCKCEFHASAILDIFNEAIVNSTALYEYTPRPLELMNGWFHSKESGGFPVIGAVDVSGQLLGFATYGTFRARPAYKYTVEHSVYVQKDNRGKGIGLLLMQRLIALAQDQQYHVLVGGIDAENQGSIEFHKKLGFTHAGTITQAGFKFGRWLDLAFYQLILKTPQHPVDG